MSLLFFGVISSFVVDDAHALDGGMLNGKPFELVGCSAPYTLDKCALGAGTLEYRITDNNIATGTRELGIITNSTKRYVYTFDRPIKVTKWQAMITKSTTDDRSLFWFYFYNENKEQVGSVKSNINVEQDIVIDNVKYILIAADWDRNTLLREFDVWGEEYLPVPSGLVATVGDREITLNWDDNPTADLTHYQVYKDDVMIATTTNRQYVVKGLQPDVEHSYYIKAVYDDYVTRSTNTVVAFALDILPRAPALKALPYDTKINLSWTSTSLDYDDFKLYQDNTLIYAGSNKSYVATGLTMDTDYTYYVTLTDKYDRVVKSNVLTVKTVEPPPPIELTLNATATHDKIDVRWNMLNAPYNVYLNDNLVFTTPLNNYSFLRLNANTTYKITVIYTDVFGRDIETSINVTTSDLPPAIVPELKISNVTHNTARLTWTISGKTYDFYRNGTKIKTLDGAIYTDQNLSPETEYTYYVTATDAHGRRTDSNVVTVTTKAEPPPKPTRPPREPPPEVANSSNPDLNKSTDYLIEGINDSKESGISLITLIILVIILVFGIWWLIKIFKQKMSKASTVKL